jgi:hypothetical protein
MKKTVLILFLFIYAIPVLAQGEFRFTKRANKVSFPFKMINNLVFIPIEVNGVELTFLLDSGVEETILFSLEDEKEISFKNTEKISLRGLGSDEAIEGLKSTNNVLKINGLESQGQLLYIILDQDFNFSSHIGIPVNGIIGYSFLKNNLVEINYEKKRIYVYEDTEYNRKKIERKFEKVPISLERSKPYINGAVVMDAKVIPVKLLVDIGNSDAIWLFQKESANIKIPEKNFDDYLGKGFSGDIIGKRALISEFLISEFKFDNPIVAFPDSNSIKHVKLVPGRMGSIGGEILKRFSVVFDYNNKNIFLRKNKEFNAPFLYNKSGVEISHAGMQWVKETVNLETIPIINKASDQFNNRNNSDFKYKFELKPVYEIVAVRKNSPASISGLQKGDVIISINKIPAYKYSLQNINALLRSEDENWVTLEVERGTEKLNFRFQLLNVL